MGASDLATLIPEDEQSGQSIYDKFFAPHVTSSSRVDVVELIDLEAAIAELVSSAGIPEEVGSTQLQRTNDAARKRPPVVPRSASSTKLSEVAPIPPQKPSVMPRSSSMGSIPIPPSRSAASLAATQTPASQNMQVSQAATPPSLSRSTSHNQLAKSERPPRPARLSAPLPAASPQVPSPNASRALPSTAMASIPAPIAAVRLGELVLPPAPAPPTPAPVTAPRVSPVIPPRSAASRGLPLTPPASSSPNTGRTLPPVLPRSAVSSPALESPSAGRKHVTGGAQVLPGAIPVLRPIARTPEQDRDHAKRGSPVPPPRPARSPAMLANQ